MNQNEIISLSKTSRRGFFKKSARSFLYNDWLCQIFAFFIVGACYVGINSFGSNLGLLVYSLTDNTRWYTFVMAFYFVFTLVMLLPLFYGLLYFEVKAIERGKGNLRDIFFPFSSTEALTFAYSNVMKTIGLGFVCFLPALLVKAFLKLFYFDGIFGFVLNVSEIDAVAVIIRTVYVFLLFVGFTASSKYIVTMFVGMRRADLSYKECRVLTEVCILGSRTELVRLVFSFLPLCIVSLFTFGFLFLLYTFPYILLTLSMFSKYLYDREMILKDTSEILYTEEN